jgi:SAM-dependent MidA family methyltransferase
MDELNICETIPHKYIIVELSCDLKFRQQEYIKNNIPHMYDRFEWLSKLPKSKVNAIVFANEVLDAMPVDVFKSESGKLVQQGVESLDGGYEFVNMQANDDRFDTCAKAIIDGGISFDDGYISELNTWIYPWIKSLKDCLNSGVVFLCDYGYNRASYYSADRSMGTLACYKNHKVNFDPFINVGEQDVTAHVDFTAVAESIVNCGFELDGYMTQANFLNQAGVASVFLDLTKDMDTNKKIKYSTDMKDLILGDKLAEMFKVISFSTGFDTVLDVFDNHDNIDYLL